MRVRAPSPPSPPPFLPLPPRVLNVSSAAPCPPPRGAARLDERACAHGCMHAASRFTAIMGATGAGKTTLLQARARARARSRVARGACCIPEFRGGGRPRVACACVRVRASRLAPFANTFANTYVYVCLLQALMGKVPLATGERFVNGTRARGSPRAMRSLIGCGRCWCPRRAMSFWPTSPPPPPLPATCPKTT